MVACRADAVPRAPDPEQAAALAAAGRWPEAAACWDQIADRALGDGDRDLAQQASAFAGDALRRDDRPAAAARALRRSIDLLDGRDVAAAARRAVLRIELCGVFVDAGLLAEAVAEGRLAVAEAPTVGVRTVALDTLTGALVTAGLVPEAAGTVSELGAVAPPAAACAVSFRLGVLRRLSGDLDGAQAMFLRSIDQLGGRPGGEGAAAAATANLAELALLHGDGPGAEAGFGRAAALWTSAGRRAGLYRAEAGRVRAALSGSATPLSSRLDQPLAYARERGLPLLEAELSMARGAARARAAQGGAGADFDRGVALAQQLGAPLLEGRLRIMRRKWGFPHSDTERCRALLAFDAVWLARVQG